MDKKRRRSVIYRIGDLCEEHCKGCTKIPSQSKNNRDLAWCNQNCDIGKELLQLGKQLEGEGKMAVQHSSYGVLTKESYEEAKKDGLTDKEAAKAFGISPATLWTRKKVWNGEGLPDKKKVQEIVKKSDINNIKAAEPTPLAKAWKNEYEELEKANDTLQRKYEAAINENTELKAKYERLELDKLEIRDQLHKTCEDLEDEIASLKERMKISERVHDVNMDKSAEQLLEMNKALIDKDALLEDVGSRYEKETDRLNAINLELHEKLQAAYTLLKLEL